jgi:hypothetical protein
VGLKEFIVKRLYPLLIISILFYWGCEDPKEEDTEKPTVTISYPLNNSTVSEMVTINCISSDNEGVEKVELWVNGVTTELTDDSEPYSFDWNTTLVDNGSYSITVRSYDTSDNTTDSEPIVLTVDNTQSNPQPINITSVVFDNGGFTIIWNQSIDGDFSTYELEKSTDSTMNSPSVVFTTDSLEQTTYFDTDVNPLIYQYYQVTVIDTFDYETKGEIYSSSLDPVPTSVNVESIEYDTEQMTISWSESSDGDFKHYNLLYSGSESGDKTSVTTISNKSTTSHSITEFNPNNENWYWVEVSDTLGQTSIGTGMTNLLNNQPTPVNVTSVTYDLESMTITWEDYVPNLSRINQMNQNTRSTVTNDFVSYELLQSDTEDGTYTSVIVITDLTTTSHSITEYDPTMENWFKVKVTDFWGLYSTGSRMTNELDSPPTQIDITSVTYDLSDMVITWVQSSDNDFVSYELLQSNYQYGIYSSVVVITDQSKTSHSITEYDPLQENWFKVKITDYWGLNSTGSGMTNSLDNIPNPVNVTSVMYDLESMTITWEDYVPNMSRINQMNQNTRSTVTNDFVSYELLQSDSEDGTYTSVTVITDQSTTLHSLTEYDPTKENWFKVKVSDYWGLNSTGSGMTNSLDSEPTPSVLYPISWDDGFEISWSQNNDDDFLSYKLYESLSEDMSNDTLIYETDDRTGITFLKTTQNIRYYQIISEDVWGLQSTSNIEFGDSEVELWGEFYSIEDTDSLNLDWNQLTGSIPSEIGNLTNLTYLSLKGNQLSGSIPPYIGNLTNLTYLNLQSNQLTGSIPPEIGNLTNLTILSLYSNQLTGTIPSEIGNLTNLTYLYLNNNQLTGIIPDEICNQGDSSPSLSNNQLCPPYPSCIEDYVGNQDTSGCD